MLSDEMSDAAMEKAELRRRQIEAFLKTHAFIRNADVRGMCGVSAATANRILTGLAAEGALIRCHEGQHWAYRPCPKGFSKNISAGQGPI